MANEICGQVALTGAIQDTQADIFGTADNIPANHTLWLAIGPTSGGPYAQFSATNPAGDNTVGQSTQNIFKNLTPNTTYFHVLQVRDATNTVVSTSAECSFTTAASVVAPIWDIQKTTNPPVGATYNVGDTITSTVTVSNTGGDGTINILDQIPTTPIGTTRTFTSAVTGGATGNTAAGTVNINDTLIVPANGTVTYTINDTVNATGTYENTVVGTPDGEPPLPPETGGPFNVPEPLPELPTQRTQEQRKCDVDLVKLCRQTKTEVLCDFTNPTAVATVRLVTIVDANGAMIPTDSTQYATPATMTGVFATIGFIRSYYTDLDGNYLAVQPTVTRTCGFNVNSDVSYGCVNGEVWEHRRFAYSDFHTGQQIAVVEGWFNPQGTEQATQPTGWKAGPCDEVDLIKTNWLPICVGGVQWYVAESSTYNNASLTESTPTKIYKQGANGAITTTEPVGAITEGYCPVDIVTVDTEFICNETTNVYDQYTITTTNGVAAAPVITPTTISCDDQEPDVETTRVCSPLTNTFHIITTSFDEAGVGTVLTDVDTLEACNQQEVDITYTTSIPLCIEEPALTFTNWLTRERILFNNITQLETKTVEFSSDSQTWTNTLPTGTIRLGECNRTDDEFLQESVILCAIVDNAPLYSIGDKVQFQSASNVNNITAPIVSVAKNLSNQTYPNPFYFQLNGVDVVGTVPNPAHFGDCPETEETDVTYTNWLPVCINNAQWYVGEKVSVVNSTGTDTLTKVYKQGADGVPTETQPLGIQIDGYCATPSRDGEVGCLTDFTNPANPIQRPVRIVDTDGTITYEEADGTAITLTTTQAVTQGDCEAVTVTESVEAGCANGVPYTRRRNVFRNASGQTVVVAVGYFDSANTETTTAPAGFTLGACVAADVENDLVYSNALEICVEDGGLRTTWFIRQSEIWDNVAGTSIPQNTEYSIDGNTWTTTVPTGAITAGACSIRPFSTVLTCYTTTANPTPQQVWARHDDSLVGNPNNFPNVDPAGIAYFTATNPVQPLILAQAGLTFGTCDVILTVDGFGQDYAGTTPAVLSAGIVSPVRSITVSVYTGTVTVVTNHSTMTIKAGSSFTWGQGTTENVNIAGWTYTGTANSDYRIHGEKEI